MTCMSSPGRGPSTGWESRRGAPEETQALWRGTEVTVSGSQYVFQGSGWGHQLGMSQYGAYAMAERGFDYDEIVEFYFPGVEVDALD